jgi:translation elongation factor EF-Tu-like GTPase
MAEPREHRVLNINVGVLGHVDSGKTSLGEVERQATAQT